jgi:glycolate oxidase iron-sulfur subunit
VDKRKKLKELEPLIEKCVLCGGCHAGCPTYNITRYERDAARGKVLLASAILKGEIEPDEKIRETFEHCLTCMNCTEICPAGADPVKVINAARNEIFNTVNGNRTSRFIFKKILTNRGTLTIFARILAAATKLFKAIPPLNFLPLVSEGKKKKFPDFKFSRLKSSYPETVLPKDGKTPFMRVGYFTGCMADSVYHDTGRAVIEILQSAGVETVLLKDEVCCGAPAYFAGDHASAGRMADTNIDLFLDKNLDYIVTSCATCGSVLKETYPEIATHPNAGKFSEKVIDYQQLISEKLFDKLNFVRPADTGNGTKRPIKVTYHDPCHLRRAMKVTEEPRRILKNLPGVEYVELPDAGACCGGAGSFGLKFYEDSLEIGRQKGESILASGAEIVLTACPSCRMQLAEIAERFAPGVETADTAQLLRKLL